MVSGLLLLSSSLLSGELVGHTGAIGSLFKPLSGGNLALSKRDGTLGVLSPPGTPIIVATPASAVRDVYQRTVPERREDLTFLCNGMVRDILAAETDPLTIACLYVGVISRDCEAGTHEIAFSEATPSILHGRHAEALGSLFDEVGLPHKVCPDVAAAREACLVKLVWSSALWLVCADTGCSVDKAHLTASYAPLVEELWAAAAATASADRHGSQSLSLHDVEAQLRAYSACLPGVVPSAELARGELAFRNGWFLRRGAIDEEKQPTHTALLRRHHAEGGFLSFRASSASI